ncbi:[histone H3]-lysine(4) N-trimethyltransferase [Ranunculus cassubicifolius]
MENNSDFQVSDQNKVNNQSQSSVQSSSYNCNDYTHLAARKDQDLPLKSTPVICRRDNNKFVISFRNNNNNVVITSGEESTNRVDEEEEDYAKSVIKEIEEKAREKFVEVKKELGEDVCVGKEDKDIVSCSNFSPAFCSNKIDTSVNAGNKSGSESVNLHRGFGLKRKAGDRQPQTAEFFATKKSKKMRGQLTQDKLEYLSREKMVEVDKAISRSKYGLKNGGTHLSGREDDDNSTHQKNGKPLIRKSQHKKQNLSPLGRKTSVSKDVDRRPGVTRYKVKETLRLYQALVRKLLQSEEAKSKRKDVTVNHRSKRADLLSAKILKENHRWVNAETQIFGEVPGVEVGDEFHFRAELALVGLHRPFQGGIDYVPRNGKIVATSIVTSWCYEDAVVDSDVLVYMGQGGNPAVGDKKPEDQKLERGNLALKNCIDEETPVRVIRGIRGADPLRKKKGSLSTRGKLVTTYTYDGLYLVEKFWQEKGTYGTDVFKFQLRRVPKQPELAIKELNSSKTGGRAGFCIEDISHGKEKVPVSVVNTLNDEKPPTFEYMTTMIYPSWYSLMPPIGCKCTDNCGDPLKCACAGKNGGEIPFNHDGAIVEVKPLVYECGPSCGCPPTCYNRVSQHGVKFQLEVFKTDSRGWGVRSLNSIPSGSFICEYTGELLEDMEAEQRINSDEYLFDIGHNYDDLWKGLSKLIPPELKSSYTFEDDENEGDVAFTIDGAHRGNVGRFINHSCSPNLYAQNVLYDHGDKRVPHIMLFAAENIPPLEELTYHYNYQLDQVHDADGNIKKKNCYCGSAECTGRMY